MKMRRLLVEVAGAPRRIGDESLSTLTLGGIEARGDRRGQSRLDHGLMFRSLAAGVLEGLAQVRRDPLFRGRLSQRMAECLVRTGIADTLQKQRTRKKRGKIERRHGKRAFDRLQSS